MTEFQLRDAARKMDELIDSRYASLVAELGTDQDEIVGRTLSEAIRQAGSVRFQSTIDWAFH